VAIMLLLGAWSFFSSQSSTSATDVSQELEKTLLAAADQDQSTDSTW
jgi:hypothetical protein